jgi:hypothetical protein
MNYDTFVSMGLDHGAEVAISLRTISKVCGAKDCVCVTNLTGHYNVRN